MRSKAEYWAKPSTRPFLITVNDEVAGFITVDDEVTHPEANFSIGYFFVGRKFRGSGVGAAAVKKLLGSLVVAGKFFTSTKMHQLVPSGKK